VAELADALASGASEGLPRGGSSPLFGILLSFLQIKSFPLTYRAPCVAQIVVLHILFTVSQYDRYLVACDSRSARNRAGSNTDKASRVSHSDRVETDELDLIDLDSIDRFAEHLKWPVQNREIHCLRLHWISSHMRMVFEHSAFIRGRIFTNRRRANE